MVCLDGARTDMLDCSEELSLLFSKGAHFKQCIVSSPYTVASIHSIMTGMYGYRNGVDAYNNMFNLKKRSKTLAEYLRAQGYFTHSDMLSDAVLSKRGFDKWTIHDENSLSSEELLEYHKIIIDSASNKGDNFFVFLQYSKIHTACVKNVSKRFEDLDEDYYSLEQTKENKRNFIESMQVSGLYAKGLFQHLEDLGIIDETLLIFFSDHGTSLGEKYGEKMYGSFVYDYTIKTFFHFIHPFFTNAKYEEQIRCIDIMPTILDFLEIKPYSSSLPFQGESILPITTYYQKSKFLRYFMNKPRDRIAYVETGGIGGLWPSPNEPNVRCIRTPNYKLIHNKTPNTWEFYNLLDDPLESNNLIGHKSKDILVLKKELNKHA